MIPTYDEMMLPFLELLKDGKEHTLQYLVSQLHNHFKATEEEKRKLTPSGQQPVFRNRVGWARTYLKKAGLLNSPKRAVFTISKRGTEILKTKPKAIDVKYLSQFEEFREFQGLKKDVSEQVLKKGTADFTPDEELELAFQKLQSSLAKDLLEEIMNSSPAFFEKLVVDLLLKMGYGGSRKDAGEAIGKSSDGGIDGIIKEDRLGLDIIYIQAKRWKANVPVREVRDFAGALLSKKARKGVFIATSEYSKGAYEFVREIEHKIILINGEELTNLMIEHNVGVETQETYKIKKVNIDYFEE